jgi:hypothetical protein
MKANTLPKHKLLLLCTAFCSAMLAVSHNANALSIGDSYELGFISPSGPSGNQNFYVNHLLDMALGSIDVVNVQTYYRSNNVFSPLPTAVAVRTGTSTTINLGGGGLYTYLLASYNGFGAEVWYVGDLSGVITIPGLAGGCGLTRWTLFVPGVPDGGITVMMLGMALGALGLGRRFLKS